jgi:hypothetical protein
MQKEEEGIDQAWDRFNGLIEQGPKLGFTGVGAECGPDTNQ